MMEIQRCLVSQVSHYPFLYIAAAVIILVYGPDMGLDQDWETKSKVALILQLLIGVACGLFLLWSLYLLIRFAIAFRMASRKLRRSWLRDDRSLANSPTSKDA